MIPRHIPSLRFIRNSPQSFLLGASWASHPTFPDRKVHIYLGLWLLTLTFPKQS